MKWTKLEYGEWPEGEIVVRIEADNDRICFEVGIISQNIHNKEWYLYMDKAFPSKASVDVLIDCNAHYIELDKLEMPE